MWRKAAQLHNPAQEPRRDQLPIGSSIATPLACHAATCWANCPPGAACPIHDARHEACDQLVAFTRHLGRESGCTGGRRRYRGAHHQQVLPANRIHPRRGQMGASHRLRQYQHCGRLRHHQHLQHRLLQRRVKPAHHCVPCTRLNHGPAHRCANGFAGALARGEERRQRCLQRRRVANAVEYTARVLLLPDLRRPDNNDAPKCLF